MAVAAPSFDLHGQIACVTGATSGLGAYAASLLSDLGAKVVGLARSEAGLKDWAQEAPGTRAYVAADLSTETDFAALGAQLSEPFGAPTVLINAAGVNPRLGADTIGVEDWDRTLNLNLRAPMFLAQALVPGMRAAGYGRIVNFASLQSERAFENGISYGASKGGVAQLTRAMAQAWGGNGITANAVAPGFFETKLTAPVFADAAKAQALADQTCLGRNGVEADLGGPLQFLCSPAGGYVTGQILYVDGGFTAK